MSYGSMECIEGLRKARLNLLKHMDGISPEQAVWKPYPGCKSIAETLEHFIWGDREALKALQTGQETDFSTVPANPPQQSLNELRAELAEASEALMSYMTERYGDAPMDTPVFVFGSTRPLAGVVGLWMNHEGYHTSQIAYIRMASDPEWDYHAAIYG